MRKVFRKKKSGNEEGETNQRDSQQDALAEELEKPAAEKTLGRGTDARKGITPNTTIQLAPDDILLARAQAGRRGLQYQTYLKTMLHEALRHEEEKKQKPSHKDAKSQNRTKSSP
jgi:predicted DNA binding CopG/RHH family protein